MVIIQRQIKPRTPRGGRKTEYRSKRLFERANPTTLVTIGEKRTETLRTKGGGSKLRTSSVETINVFNPKTKKHSQTKVKMLVECASNRNYVRRNIMVKGAVVETELGKVKLTSKPSQNGSVDGILIA